MGLNRNVNIAWCDHSYNGWKGCAKVSEGCLNCWAEDIMTRFDHTDEDWTIANIDANLTVYDEDPTDILDIPPAWIFMPSSSDPFLPWLPIGPKAAVMEALTVHSQHCFQVLTKWGAEKAGADIIWNWPENVLLGVSVETPRRKYRIDWLREQKAHMRFVSFEPLIERIDDVDLSGIDWIIVGGESCRKAEDRREMDPEWAVRLYEIARDQDVPFLFKQHSGTHAESDRLLDVGDGRGPREFNEFPDVPKGVPDAPIEYLEAPA